MEEAFVGWEDELREHYQEQGSKLVNWCMECLESEGDGSGREGFRQGEDNGEVKEMVARGSRERNW